MICNFHVTFLVRQERKHYRDMKISTCYSINWIITILLHSTGYQTFICILFLSQGIQIVEMLYTNETILHFIQMRIIDILFLNYIAYHTSDLNYKQHQNCFHHFNIMNIFDEDCHLINV